MERRSSPRFLKFTIALGIAVAVLTSTVRAEPGSLHNPFRFRMCADGGSLTLVVNPPAPVPPARTTSGCGTGPGNASPAAATIGPENAVSKVTGHTEKHRATS